MTLSGPGPVSAAAGSVVFLFAQATAPAVGTTPLTVLATILGAIVALLGWIVKAQHTAAQRREIAAEGQAEADRKEREKDRGAAREERDKMLAVFQAQITEERERADARHRAQLEELGSGRFCNAPRVT